MNAYSDDHLNLALNDINVLDASPSSGEVRAAWIVMSVLLAACLITVPFATRQWPVSHVLDTAAGIASFAEITTGALLLTQAVLLRQSAGLALGLGYLLGGMVIIVNLLCTASPATHLWLLRLWHGVFVLGVLSYAVLNTRHDPQFSPDRFKDHVRIAIGSGVLFMAMMVLYLVFRPFPLPAILHGMNYATRPNIVVNAIQLVVIVGAWLLLLTARHKTVLSVWMGVVACAVAIDIVLFVLGTTAVSVGLDVSKLNNFIAATLIFSVLFYRYIRIQSELYKHRAELINVNRRLTEMALTDTLTGLPNRAALEQTLDNALARAGRANAKLAVCMIDLDDFKLVNDGHGHQIGDQLLSAFGDRVSGVLRKGEHFGRMGGDEFVLVLEGLERSEQVSAVMKRVADALSAPFVLSPGLALHVRVSIGVALYPNFRNGSDLMRAADQALYRSKAKKGSRDRNWTVGGAGSYGEGECVAT